MSFRLSIGGDEQPFDDDLASELSDLIVGVATGRVEFLILTREATGEYLQCAGANEALIAERRDRAAQGWAHYRLCRRGGSRERLPPAVEGYQGYEARELLDVGEVELAFEDFMAGRPPSDTFEIGDTMDADTASVVEPASESGGIFGRLRRRLFG